MGLNLNSLKNISASQKAPDITPPSVHTTAYQPTTMTEEKPQNIEVTPKSLPNTKLPGTGAKFSLSKLRWEVPKDEIIPSQELDIEDGLSVAQIEQAAMEKIEAQIHQEKITQTIGEVAIKEKNEWIIDHAKIILTEKKNIHDIQTSESILWDIATTPELWPDEKISTQSDIAPIKELFPNLHTRKIDDIDEDLLDLKEIIGTDSSILDTNITTQAQQIDTQSTPIIVVAEEESSGAVHAIQESTITWDGCQIEIWNRETTIITPAYVEEIKTDLSQERRAGLRFLVKNKHKIMAGIGIVFSLSIIAIFSGTMIWTEIQKSWKTNILEDTMVNTTKPTVQEIAPGVINYEIWRDYSITKNTKKNISTKGIGDTLSGTKAITP